MLVRMLRTVPGADDGITVALYKEGEKYDISESLAKNFFVMNAAEKISMISKIDITEKKNLGDAPENKMVKRKVEDK